MPESLQKVVNNEIQELEEEKIPAIVAISEQIEDYENKKVVLSFEPYTKNSCEIYLMQKPDANHFTDELKKITTTLKKHFLHQNSSTIACKSVKNSGNYSPLFNNVPEDSELLEVDYTKAGRIFGYLTHNIFNIVAVRVRHIK